MTDRTAAPLGRRPATPDKPRARFANFTSSMMIPPFALPATDTTPSLSWPMDLNDRWGDCVVAAGDHFRQIVAALLGRPYTNLDTAGILAEYRTQNPGFDPASSTHGPGSNDDGGMIVQDYLAHLVRTGTPGDPLRVLGFAAVDPTNLDELHTALYLGLGIITGETLQVAQQTQSVWDYALPGSRAGQVWGGHCTVHVGYRDATLDELVTWGEVVPCTRQWVNRQVDEAWFVITQAHVDRASFRAGFDLAGFAEEYTALTGRPFPVDVTPTPTPPPTPAPDPATGATFRLTPAVAARVARTATGARVSPDAWLDHHLRTYYKMPPSAWS